MPRIARSSAGGVCYHVINRGNGRRQIFHEDGDYESFLIALAHADDQLRVPVLAYCLMPNHFHLVVRPENDGDLSRWMHWLLNAFVRRYHKHHESSGHIWQDRFKSFPIEEDEHLLTVLRYVERNPVRANLAPRAERWPWSSARHWGAKAERPGYLAPGPVPRPRDWLKWVNRAATPAELDALRRSVNRGAPFGDADWIASTANRLGLQSTLRPRGRPRKPRPSPADGTRDRK